MFELVKEICETYKLTWSLYKTGESKKKYLYVIYLNSKEVNQAEEEYSKIIKNLKVPKTLKVSKATIQSEYFKERLNYVLTVERI